MVLTQACEPLFKQRKTRLTATYGFQAFMLSCIEALMGLPRRPAGGAGIGWSGLARLGVDEFAHASTPPACRVCLGYGTVCETEIKTYVRGGKVS